MEPGPPKLSAREPGAWPAQAVRERTQTLVRTIGEGVRALEALAVSAGDYTKILQTSELVWLNRPSQM